MSKSFIHLFSAPAYLHLRGLLGPIPTVKGREAGLKPWIGHQPITEVKIKRWLKKKKRKVMLVHECSATVWKKKIVVSQNHCLIWKMTKLSVTRGALADWSWYIKQLAHPQKSHFTWLVCVTHSRTHRRWPRTHSHSCETLLFGSTTMHHDPGTAT